MQPKNKTLTKKIQPEYHRKKKLGQNPNGKNLEKKTLTKNPIIQLQKNSKQKKGKKPK